MPEQAPTTEIAPRLPPGAWDTHIHIFGPQDRYPLAPDRRYTPDLADVSAARAMLERSGMTHAVLIQPSPYGEDHRCLLDAMAELGQSTRAIIDVLAAASMSREALEALHGKGIRGVRLNFAVGATGPDLGIEVLNAIEPVLAELGWHVEINPTGGNFERAAAVAAKSRIPVVLDHFGGVDLDGPEAAGLQDQLCRLLKSGAIWVKLSAAYRLRPSGSLDAVDALASRLVDLAPERLLYGSDWPHTPPHSPAHRRIPQPFRQVETASLLPRLAVWTKTAETFARVLVENPKQLYD